MEQRHETAGQPFEQLSCLGGTWVLCSQGIGSALGCHHPSCDDDAMEHQTTENARGMRQHGEARYLWLAKMARKDDKRLHWMDNPVESCSSSMMQCSSLLGVVEGGAESERGIEKEGS